MKMALIMKLKNGENKVEMKLLKSLMHLNKRLNKEADSKRLKIFTTIPCSK